MAHVERNATWYSPWPKKGVSYAKQLLNTRTNTEEARALVRRSLLDIDDTGENDYFAVDKALRGLEYGRLEFKNKFRTYYDDDGTYQHLTIQRNTGTEKSPTWVEVLKVDESVGTVTVGDGGIISTGGFYGVG
ncbi:unnamed protein product, partial [marine sediment metagenome]